MKRRILNIFQQNKKSSASVAKERLQIIISHERGKNQRANLLAGLQQELVDVIARHLKIDASLVKDQVRLDLAQSQGHSVLELNITLPDEELAVAE